MDKLLAYLDIIESILVNGWICGHWFIHKDDSIEVKWFVSVTSDVKKRALAEVEKYLMWRNRYF